MTDRTLHPASMPETESQAAAAPKDGDWPSPARAWYATGVLSLALMFSTIDRQILALLVEPIKRDMNVGDTEMSLLLGFAFVAFYAFLSLPIARLADRKSRRLIIGIGITAWSTMTAVCGLAQNYWQLFVARMGVGAGEASFGPATYSILADSFPREKLPRATAVISLGYMAGAGLALIVGGTVIELVKGLPDMILPGIGIMRPWQLAFLMVGLPGLLVALLMRTVKEPKRRGLIGQRDGGKPPKALPVKQVVKFLADDWKAYGPIFVSVGIKAMLSLGVTMWVPTFFIRTYGWTSTQIGYAQGIILLTVFPIGLIIGGWLAGWYARKGHDDANMRVVLYATVGVLPFAILFPLMPNPYLALALYAANGFIASIGVGPVNAALQIITPNQMRGQVSAMYLFIFNIIGYALGPTVIALLTDYVFQDEAALRYSMALNSAIILPIATFIVWYGVKPYGRSVGRASAWAAT